MKNNQEFRMFAPLIFGSILLLSGCGGSGGSGTDGQAAAGTEGGGSTATTGTDAPKATPIEEKLKAEQIAVLEKMAEEFEKVKDTETFKQARFACRDLESKFQKLNEEFNARPEKEKEAARIRLEATETAAMSRLREAKSNAQKKVAPPPPPKAPAATAG